MSRKKGNLKDDDDYPTDDTEDEIINGGRRQPESKRLQQDMRNWSKLGDASSDSSSDEEERSKKPPADKSKTVPARSGSTFSLRSFSSSSSSSSSSDDEEASGGVLVKSTSKVNDSKRRRSDQRAQGPNHDLERVARGANYMARSPPQKRQMTKASVETKLCQGRRESMRKEKEMNAIKEAKRAETERKKVERERKKAAREAAKVAKQKAEDAHHWKSTAGSNKTTSRQKPVVKKESEKKVLHFETPRTLREMTDVLPSDDDSVQFVGSSPIPSAAAARMAAARAGTAKPPKVRGDSRAVEGSELLEAIKKDTLNQSRAVKRHVTKVADDSAKLVGRIVEDHLTKLAGNSKEETLQLQEAILDSIKKSSRKTVQLPHVAAAKTEDLEQHFAATREQFASLRERMSAQDGILNTIHVDVQKLTNAKGPQIKKMKATVDETLELMKKCPHSSSGPTVTVRHNGGGDSGGDGNGSFDSMSIPEGAGGRGGHNQPIINVSHRHQCFQHSHMGDSRGPSGTQNAAPNNASRSAVKAVNPYLKPTPSTNKKPAPKPPGQPTHETPTSTASVASVASRRPTPFVNPYAGIGSAPPQFERRSMPPLFTPNQDQENTGPNAPANGNQQGNNVKPADNGDEASNGHMFSQV